MVSSRDDRALHLHFPLAAWVDLIRLGRWGLHACRIELSLLGCGAVWCGLVWLGLGAAMIATSSINTCTWIQNRKTYVHIHKLLQSFYLLPSLCACTALEKQISHTNAGRPAYTNDAINNGVHTLKVSHPLQLPPHPSSSIPPKHSSLTHPALTPALLLNLPPPTPSYATQKPFSTQCHLLIHHSMLDQAAGRYHCGFLGIRGDFREETRWGEGKRGDGT